MFHYEFIDKSMYDKNGKMVNGVTVMGEWFPVKANTTITITKTAGNRMIVIDGKSIIAHRTTHEIGRPENMKTVTDFVATYYKRVMQT